MNLTKIYTRTGDDGTTALGDFSRTSKNDSRLHAYADVDEANSSIGAALAFGEFAEDVVALLTRIQNDLFDVGADLCTPIDPKSDPDMPQLRVTEDYIDRLESECDKYNDQLEKLRSFILPGGTKESASLHVSRTIARRAERLAWQAIDEFPDSTNVLTAKYLNRLSDLLFILARYANLDQGGDVLWVPGGER